MSILNRLHEARGQRGVSAAELARQAGVSRQTIHAMESGSYVPNTSVALRLAAALAVSVEDLFQLQDEAPESPETVAAEVLAEENIREGQAVRLARVGAHFVAGPATPTCARAWCCASRIARGWTSSSNWGRPRRPWRCAAAHRCCRPPAAR